MMSAGYQIPNENQRRQCRHHLDDEHHRVLGHVARVKLGEGGTNRRPDDLGIEQGRCWDALACLGGVHRDGSSQFRGKRVPAVIARCSTIGPSASAGKKVRPPIIRMTPTTRPMNRPPVVGNVPTDGGTDFLSASDPAIAIAGMIIQKRPTSIAMAPVTL